MTERSRTQRLDDDLNALSGRAARPRRDALLVGLGVLLLVAGIVVAVAGYAISAGTSDPLRQNDAQTLGPIGITLSIAGAVLFLRYSAVQFLRFWLARLVHAQQTSSDPPKEH
jgi:hypothetical protein